METSPHKRRIFCNRTLNLRSIRAVGYDMDYTLIHYNAQVWESRAFDYLKEKLLEMGWPVADTTFDPDFVVRGLIIDRELGNIVKANRFGYIKRAAHGRRMLTFEEQRRTYAQTMVDLTEDRWVFMNTLFSISKANMFAHLVEELDRQPTAPSRNLPDSPLGYADLYDRVKAALDEAHMEGQLKAEVVADPARFVVLDPDVALALRDQQGAGRKLVLITNSGWAYTRAMMSYAYDRFLPDGMSWRELFDVIIVSAGKPGFFTDRMPIFKVVDDEGLLRPCPGGIEAGHQSYWGGNASQVEQALGCSGAEILYVGDHIYSDVHVSKSVRRWRTALILRELEDELAALEVFRDDQRRLDELMQQKTEMEYQYSQLRLQLQRRTADYGPGGEVEPGAIQRRMGKLRQRLLELDEAITPLAIASSELYSPRWGLLTRAGNDKSNLARQLERHADIYTSRVSNFLMETPFGYLRSPRGSLPHDRSG